MSNIPAKTSLYIGPGLRVEGRVVQTSKDEVIVVAGTLAGDIVSEGAVLVEEGGLIEATNELRCFDLRVSGKIEGKDVIVESGLLHLEGTALVEVGEVNLPPGGLEQSRGSILCAKIVMTQENAFAKDERRTAPTKDSMQSKVALDRPAQMAAALSQMRVNTPSAGQVTPTAAPPSPAPSALAPSLSGAARVVPLAPATSSLSMSAASSESAFADDKDDEEETLRAKMA